MSNLRLLVGTVIINHIFLSLTFAVTNPLPLNFERFTHMTPETQEKIIILGMDYMVDTAKLTKYQVSKNLESDTNNKLYTFFKLKIENLFIENSYAASINPELASHFEAFKSILDDTEQNLKGRGCFYAGWPSITNSQGICIHPKNYVKTKKSGTQFKVYSYYKSHGGNDCKSNQIACNPSIFGFKKIDDNSTFCVDLKNIEQIKNASFECRKLALNDSQNESDKDSKDKRLQSMRSALGKMKGAIDSVYVPMIKSCMCDAEDYPTFNRSYGENIKKTQTCYSLLDILSETLACDIEGQSDREENFKEILEKYKSDSKEMTNEEARIYQEKVVFDKKSNSYQKICQGKDLPKKCDTSEAKCTFNLEELSCTGIKIGDKVIDGEVKFKCPQGKCASISVKTKDSQNESDCLAPIQNLPIFQCSLTNCSGSGEKKQCTPKLITDQNLTKELENFKIPDFKQINVGDKPQIDFEELSFKMINYKLSCNLENVFTCEIKTELCISTENDKLKCGYKIKMNGSDLPIDDKTLPTFIVGNANQKDYVLEFLHNSIKVNAKCNFPSKSIYSCSVDSCSSLPDGNTGCSYSIKKQDKILENQKELEIIFSGAESSKIIEGNDNEEKFSVNCQKPGTEIQQTQAESENTVNASNANFTFTIHRNYDDRVAVEVYAYKLPNPQNWKIHIETEKDIDTISRSYIFMNKLLKNISQNLLFLPGANAVETKRNYSNYLAREFYKKDAAYDVCAKLEHVGGVPRFSPKKCVTIIKKRDSDD